MERIPGITPVRRAFWRRHWRLAVVLAVLAAAPFAAIEGYKAWLRLDPEWRFAERVLLGFDLDDEEAVVMRWTKPVPIFVLGGTREDHDFIAALVADINEVLEGSPIFVRIAHQRGKGVEVVFVNENEFTGLIRELSGRPTEPTTGRYFLWWDARKAMTRGVAVIRADLATEERQATIVHEVAHTLGLRGHTPMYRESVVFARDLDKSWSTGLSPIDRKLLRFLYSQLSPGADWLQTRNAYRHYWATETP